MFPADQGFKPDDFAGRQRQTRLIVEDEFVFIQCTPELRFMHQPLHWRDDHVRIIEPCHAGASFSGFGQGDTGIFQKGIGIGTVARINAAADADGDGNVMSR